MAHFLCDLNASIPASVMAAIVYQDYLERGAAATEDGNKTLAELVEGVLAVVDGDYYRHARTWVVFGGCDGVASTQLLLISSDKRNTESPFIVPGT